MSAPVVEGDVEELQRIIYEHFNDDLLLVCGRVWEAWQYGTMKQDDFSRIDEDDAVLPELIEKLAPLLAARQQAVEEARQQIENLDAQTSKAEWIREPIMFEHRDEEYSKTHKNFLTGVYAGYAAAKQDAIAALTQRGEGGGSEQASI